MKILKRLFWVGIIIIITVITMMLWIPFVVIFGADKLDKIVFSGDRSIISLMDKLK